MIVDILFYIFSTILISAAIAVILARNPVHSIFFLIFAFFNAAALFILMGAELLAMLLVIIYVGAVAVLFLFVVMMLNIDFAKLKRDFMKIAVISIATVTILIIELYTAYKYSAINDEITNLQSNPAIAYPISDDISNSKQIGLVLYTDFAIQFQLAGIILLVAMIGAVVLTLRTGKNSRKQVISKQVSRTREESVKLVKVLSNKGI